MKIESLTKQVENCLERNEQTRNSDIALTIMLWQEYYPNHIGVEKGTGFAYVKLETLFALPNVAEIGRIRRKFQEMGKYPPTDENVAKQRRILEKEWRRQMMYSIEGEPVQVIDLD